MSKSWLSKPGCNLVFVLFVLWLPMFVCGAWIALPYVAAYVADEFYIPPRVGEDEASVLQRLGQPFLISEVNDEGVPIVVVYRGPLGRSYETTFDDHNRQVLEVRVSSR